REDFFGQFAHGSLVPYSQQGPAIKRGMLSQGGKPLETGDLAKKVPPMLVVKPSSCLPVFLPANAAAYDSSTPRSSPHWDVRRCLFQSRSHRSDRLASRRRLG